MYEKTAAALIVGSGIGGMQAALDLAETGIKVYLLDRKPCIGGLMSQLDKTFPTNDCAMCSMAPRLVEIGRHKDIKLLTLCEVESIKGEPGNFIVSIKKKARFIDEDKCTGCGECEEKCPIHVISDYNLELSERKAIYRRYPQAIPSSFLIDKLGQSPCRVACPIGQRAQGYVALIKEKRFEDAFKTILLDNPFPSVCGRVCRHYCEDECTRARVDGPVAVRNLKKFVADWAFENRIIVDYEKAELKNSKPIAIIGSGPAGLTCAKDLRIKGYKVTVFEALPLIGGMLRVGIPKFRLPWEIIERDIQSILTDGIEVKTNSKIESTDELFAEGYGAVFIAVGTHIGKKLNIKGADLAGVYNGIDVLRKFALQEKIELGEKALILGGGNVAMDVARTIVRLGVKDVKVICLESREKMPADKEEIQEAEKEGIVIYPSYVLSEIIPSAGRVERIKCHEVRFKGFDAERKPIIESIKGTEEEFAVDNVIFAIRQSPEIPFVNEGIEVSQFGTIKVDLETLATSKPGVFAGGDVVTGTKFIVDAIAAGHKAAASIDLFLKGEEFKKVQTQPHKVELTDEEIAKRIKNKEKLQTASKPMGASRDQHLVHTTEFTEEQAVQEAERCLACAICSECLQCVTVCGREAIDHEMPSESLIDINVGAVILTSGCEIYDPDLKKEFGYSRYANVISSLQFERILSASGPFKGEVLRLSDKQKPQKIAFIQCVGSRDTENNYCSSICCMAAIKEAIIAKEHDQDLECTIFYIDIRAFSKGYEDYYNRAKELGVKFIRCRPSSIKEVPHTKDLRVKYQTAENKVAEDVFNLVVLSVGLQPSGDIKDFAGRLDIKIDENNFYQTEFFEPVMTSREGIMVSGTANGPKDIPETVLEASAAGSEVMALLADVRGNLIKPKVYPAERLVADQNVRVGVFICHCGKNIGGVINIPKVREFTKTLADVAYVEDNLYTCSTDTAQQIMEAIENEKLNRVVVASCSPRTHEVLFQETLRESGLNPYLFEMANIRDQCSWPHMHEPEKATEKAKDLIAMAIAKVRLLEELYPQNVKVNQQALVIGGGLAGMTAALTLASFGVKTYLIEKEKELGGNLTKLYFNFRGDPPQQKLLEIIAAVNKADNIHVYKETELKEVNGEVGNFKTKIISVDKCEEIEHGIIIVATGAREYKPQGEYLYGQNENVITQVELEKKLALDEEFAQDKLNQVVMIQCVGARDENNTYCSRICCNHAVKNALIIKELNPETNIFVLYRDIRTYGLHESYYREAREKGVLFIPYEEDAKPEVLETSGKLQVKVRDSVLDTDLLIDSSLVVLSTGPVPPAGNDQLSQLLKISLSQDKFFLEKHVKLSPSECATPGIFLSGLAHYSKTVEETIISAKAAVMSGWRIISQDERELEPRISFVVHENCDGCAYCIDPCPNAAITLLEYMYQGAVKKIVEVNESLCLGCGSCMATCPKKGIYIKSFSPEQIMAQVEAALVK